MATFSFTRSSASRDAGLTLVEILVTIIIIGIVSGIAYPIIMDQTGRSDDTVLRADMSLAARLVTLAQNQGNSASGAVDLNTMTQNVGSLSSSARITLWVSQVEPDPGATKPFCLKGVLGKQNLYFDSVTGEYSETLPGTSRCPL